MALIRFYLKVAISTLAAVGAASIVGLQTGWVDIPGVVDYPKTRELAYGHMDKVVGPLPHQSEFISVDTARTYSLSAWVRASSNRSGAKSVSRVILGIQAFDADRQPLLDGRALRYPTASGNVATRLDGWVLFRGTISGEAAAGQNAFPEGTRWVRVFVIPNYGSEDVSTDIADVLFAPVLPLEARPAKTAN